MPNEFVAKNGLVAQNNSVVSGSLVVTNGITGSLFGTSSQAVSASFTATSSFGFNAVSASYAFTASSASNSFSAVSSSFANNYLGSGSISTRLTNTETTASNLVTASGSFSSRVTNTEITSSNLVIASSSFSTRITSDSSSFSSRVSSLEATTASLQIASSSFSIRVTNTETTASNLVLASGSFSTRVTNTEITASNLVAASGSFSTRVTQIERTYATTGSNIYTGSQNILGAITASSALINGTLTAQTLVVTTVSSSVVFSSGSNIFGNSTANTQTMTGSLNVSGSATIIGRVTATDITGSLFGTASWATNFLTGSVTSASFAFTASSAISASFASTASFVNTLNQNVVITGSLTIGTGSGNSAAENTLTIGPAGAGGSGEGGQLLLMAKSDGFTSASMLDTYQNRFRLLRGTNTGSTAEVLSANLNTNQIAFTSYTSAGSFPGTVVANLAVDSGGNILTVAAGTVTSASYAFTASSATNAFQAVSSSFATTASTVIATVTGTNSTELVRGNMADNDQFRILVGGTATNTGFAEIATADDGTEPIHVRQYSGVFASLVRTATLLDGSGNTSFPGTVSATFSGNLTGTASFASNYLGSGSISTRLTNLETASANLVTASGSFSTRVTNTETTASNLVAASASFSTRITSDSSSFSSRVSSIEATTASLQVASGSFSTRVTQIERTYATTGSNIYTGSQNILGAITASSALINGTITAQTLVVTTISSSVVFSSGSNIFGNSTANTQTFTGSVNITGSTVSLRDGSFSGSGANLYNIPASGITGLNLSQIATGSATASVGQSTSSFQVTSGSNTLMLLDNSGSLRIGSGSLTNPALSFATGSLGIYSSSPNRLDFVTAGSQRMAILNNGNVVMANASTSVIGNNFLDFTDNTTGFLTTTTTFSIVAGTGAAGTSRTIQRVFGATGNVAIQNGGTFTDAGFRLDVSGSTRITNNLTVSGSTQITGSVGVTGSLSVLGSITGSLSGSITGSLFGTSSQAVSSSYALTASFALNAGGGGFPFSGSAQITGSLGVTGSFSVSANQGSSVFSSNADTLLITGSLIITGSGAAITGSLNVSNGITGSLFGTASQAVTASYALTASFVASIAGLSTSQIATGSVTASVGQSTASFQLVSGSTNFLYVSNSGNIGINNAAPSLLSGGTGLSVSGSSYTQLQLRGQAAGVEFVPPTGDTWEIQAANNVTNPNSFFIYNRTDLAYRFLIDGSGNVAIGGIRPSASLDVSGSFRYTNTLSGTGSVNISGSVSITGSLNISGSVSGSAGFTGSFSGSLFGPHTGSLFGTSSWAQTAVTASYALGGSASSILFQTASAATTWSFNHFLQTQYPVFTIYDEGNNVIVPQQITAVDTSSALIYFSSPKRGVAVASKGGYSASVVTSATTANTAITASYALLALSASNAPGFTFTFSQSLAAVTWSINHNMNTRTPLVQVYDIGYNQLIPNQIVSVTQNLTEVRFDYGQNGYAVLSSGMAPFVTGSTSLLNQTTPALTWSFAHNLNSKYVNFEVYDSTDYTMIPSAIRVIDTNNAEIHMAYPTTGRAVANFSGINGQMNAQTASLALTASFVLPLSQSVAITGSGTTNSTLDITGLRASTGVNPPRGTISLHYPGADGATAGVYGASIMFSQRYSAADAAPIGMAQISSVKIGANGNFGGGLAFWTSNRDQSTLVERMRIDASGSVGINKISPSASLDVSGSMLVTGSLGMTGSFTQNGYAILTAVSQSLNFANDASAAAGGVPLGGLYRSGNFILIRLS